MVNDSRAVQIRDLADARRAEKRVRENRVETELDLVLGCLRSRTRTHIPLPLTVTDTDTTCGVIGQVGYLGTGKCIYSGVQQTPLFSFVAGHPEPCKSSHQHASPAAHPNSVSGRFRSPALTLLTRWRLPLLNLFHPRISQASLETSISFVRKSLDWRI